MKLLCPPITSVIMEGSKKTVFSFGISDEQFKCHTMQMTILICGKSATGPQLFDGAFYSVEVASQW